VRASITDTLLSISGTKVVDVPAVLGAVGEGAAFRQIPGRRLLTICAENLTDEATRRAYDLQ